MKTKDVETVNELKIMYKKSSAKFGKRKTLLFEVKSSWDKDAILFLTDRSKLLDIQKDPSVVLEILNTIPGLSKVSEKAVSTSAKIKVIYKGIIRNKTFLISKE